VALAISGCAAHGGRLSEFEAALAVQDSATAALGAWCKAHAIADPAAIAAQPVRGEDAAPPAGLSDLLQTGAAPGYRHVRLACGPAVLSEAHNWYVPQRLTPEMNAALASSDTPFGRVAAPLRFTRERLAARRGRAPGCPRGTVLSNRALLRLPDGKPLSYVVECYTQANIAGQ
jgi:hypothetical protein